MSIEQALSERTARKIPHWKRRKVKAPQHEFAFAADAFQLVGEIMAAPEPPRAEPEKAAELFAEMRWTLTNNAKTPRA